MHPPSVANPEDPAVLARSGGPHALAQALLDSRRDTLATFAAFEAALPGLRVPQLPHLNPPLWELGHVGWFQNHWVARHPAAQRRRGWRADPLVPRLSHAPGHRPQADALYDSSRVAHAARWSLPLPGAAATRDELAQGLQATLGLLEQEAGQAGQAEQPQPTHRLKAAAVAPAPGLHDVLYSFRLALLHEDMHHEAALYMARVLGVPVADARWRAQPLPSPGAPLAFEACAWQAGTSPDAGFAFDNECGALELALPACEIDAQVVSWAEYLPFVEAGGLDEPRWWTAPGWAWRMAQRDQERVAQGRAAGETPGGFEDNPGPALPRYLRREGARWLCWRDGRWGALDLREAACHLSLHEAQAWCAWAGRRLPTEFEWERAALQRGADFAWGEVWEWTASVFGPFPGFEPHPYRDYSAPWFDGRAVLRGASHLTQPRMRHVRYRNFFPAHRSDVPAGFRSCAA